MSFKGFRMLTIMAKNVPIAIFFGTVYCRGFGETSESAFLCLEIVIAPDKLYCRLQAVHFC